MEPSEFLRTILPTDGHYAVVSIKNKKIKQTLIEDLNELAPLAAAAIANKEDLYYGCASYTTNENRKQDNVLGVKSLWVDLDCGAGTAYETQQDGFDALKSFCKKTQMPKPWVVNSGRGLHVYWPLNDAILTPVWSVYAKRLVELATKHGLSIKDPGCSTDVARILRVPGSYNFKDPADPLEVKVLCGGAVSLWGNLKDTIQAACGAVDINGFKPTHKAAKRILDPITAALAGNFSSSFRTIITMSLQGNGCAYIADAFIDQSTASEELWRAGLSIAVNCTERAAAIHKLSSKYPTYSYAETETKAAALYDKPYTCETIALKVGGSHCATCKHRGKFKSPISLGKQLIVAAVPATPIVLVPHSPKPIKSSMPKNYVRGVNGGIYRLGMTGSDGTIIPDDLIYPHDLDIISRYIDPDRGECILGSVTLPKDGLREFSLPLSDCISIETLKTQLSKYSIVGHKEEMTKVSTYVINSVKHLQETTKASDAVTQMGWSVDKQSIVWGRTRFTKQGAMYCPPAPKARSVADMMKTAGSFDVWESILERYSAPGLELQACCLMAAFGSMLNGYTYEDPVWLHMVSGGSGTGKSTLTKVISSLWGAPADLMLGFDDTALSVSRRRIVLNSMAACQDEITNMKPEELSRLAYSQSVKKERNRLKSDTSERSNSDIRTGSFISNGNNHFKDVIAAFKTNASGELARLLEIQFDVITQQLSSADHFGRIESNYGFAGIHYAPWLVEHEGELLQRTQQAKEEFTKAVGGTVHERNWMGLSGTIFAALDILQNELGILKKFDRTKMHSAWCKFIKSQRGAVADSIVSHEHFVGEFINENNMNIVVPDSTASKITDTTTANIYGRKTEREARNRLVIRWERDVDIVYIAQSELKLYCTKRSHSYTELMNYLTGTEAFIGAVNKRMGVGVGIPSSSIRALAFKGDKGEIGSMVKEVVSADN